MKKLIIGMLFSMFSLFGCSQKPTPKEETKEMDFLSELEAMPVGIDVVHSPSTVEGPKLGLDTGCLKEEYPLILPLLMAPIG